MTTTSGLLDHVTIDELDDDPYPTWQYMRKHAPVAWLPAADAWFVTTFETCAIVGEPGNGFIGAEDHPTLSRVFGKPNVLTSNGDEHKDLREGIDPSLQPKSVNEHIDDIVRPVAREYLEKLRAKTSGDLVTEFFEPVSVEALRHVMGLNHLVDADTLRRWFTDLNSGIANFSLEPEGFSAADRAADEINEIVVPHLEKLRREPDDSMLSHMIWAGREGGEPRPVELIMPSLRVLLLGGMQEPGHAAASSMYGLFLEPDQLAAVYADPDEHIPLAVNEGLRWIAPIGVVERQAERDVELMGQLIPKGSIVQVALASANRDETRFDEPDRFNIFRSSGPHQAFGNGEHFCAGHFFGRQVERIMFEELFEALPNLRLDPAQKPVVNGWVFRAPKSLPSIWDPNPIPVEAATPAQSVAVGITPTTTRMPDTYDLVVKGMVRQTEDVMTLTLVAPDGSDLPEWTPGAHIDLWVTEERAGQYSLAGDPADRKTYVISVLREPQSRGTSEYVLDYLRPGQTMQIGGPRNNFELVERDNYLFIAGGIGITPMLPMMNQAERDGKTWRLAYCGSSRSNMSHLADVEAHPSCTELFVKDEHRRANIETLIQEAAAAGATVYSCGPERMLDEVEALGEKHNVEVFIERFDAGEAHRDTDRAFEIKLAKSGETYEVAPGDTALRVLLNNGYEIRRSCSEGNCGSCETRVIEGEIDHRDVLLTKAQREKNDRMMVCVSRAKGDSVTLDL